MNPLSATHSGGPSSDSASHTQGRPWLRWATAVLAADLIGHTAAIHLTHDWEGWEKAIENFSFVLVTGLVIVGSTYGLLVRWGLKPSPHGRNRAAIAALIAGAASLVSYVIFFTFAPVLIAPAALLLAREALRSADEHGGRGQALTGAALGTVSLAVFGAFLTVLIFTGEFPFGM